MKITRKQTTLLLSMLVMACIGAVYAQTRTVKIVKGEEVLFSYPAEQIDFMTVVNQLEQPIGLKTEMGDNSITVTWNAVPGAEAYVVSRSGDGQNYTELAQVKTTTYVDNNPLNGENHYQVIAIGTGFVSSEAATTSTNFGSTHAYVDLGLPSGLKWATCNIGASEPYEYGDYYAWGETTTKSEYIQDNNATYGKSASELKESGVIDSEGNLTAQYDAASVNWGGSWRLPTDSEWRELVDKCTWTWTTESGMKGYKVTGPNGNTIFLPAAGYRGGSDLNYAGSYGNYWSSTVYSIDRNAYILDFDSGDHDVYYSYRYYGQSLRPVSE